MTVLIVCARCHADICDGAYRFVTLAGKLRPVCRKQPSGGESDG